MKQLFSFLALIWLTACAALPRYSSTEPAAYYATIDTYAYPGPTSQPAGRVSAGERYLVVGYYSGWYVINSRGHKYLVAADALTVDTGTPPPPSAYPSPYQAPVGHDTYTGPRGGQYYYNGNGNKQYVTPQSTIDNNTIYTGPRGGQYYINGSGRKTYIKH